MTNVLIKRLAMPVATVLMVTTLAGCGNKEVTIDVNQAVNNLLNEVSYSTEIEKVTENADLYFPNLPAGATLEMYVGNGYFADELVHITLASEEDMEVAMAIVNSHIEELRKQFLNYVPKEVDKIDKAVIFKDKTNIVLCITDDLNNAKAILNGKTEELGKAEQEISNVSSANAAEIENNYPKITSESGEYTKYGKTAIRVDNKAFEVYDYVDSAANAYTKLVNQVADQLEGVTEVYDMPIPTAIGIVLPDDIRAILPNYQNQNEVIEKIASKFNDNVKVVNTYDNLMKHRDEYLYFRTDYHWNGKGAYYAYETFCDAIGTNAIPLEVREKKEFTNFLGELYWHNSKEDKLIGATPDVVEAYLPKSAEASMNFTDAQGNTYEWDIINDVSKYKSSVKYSTFAGADNPISVFTNPQVTDGSVAIVVKESYGNALMPFLVDHFSTIYEIDYRYWDGDLVKFAKEKQADTMLFANNLSMIRSNYLIGKLGGIIK